MTDGQVIEEVKRYVMDTSYPYAILIDGEWGSGKTYFIQHSLLDAIKSIMNESDLQGIKYISLYGCHTLKDVQEAIIWSFANEVKRIVNNDNGRSSNVVLDNIYTTSRQILKGIKDHFLSDINVYDISADWLLMKNYLFVFDDLERCDCQVNELFGFLNGLVEHEKTKVILVANEREIFLRESQEQKELQYMLALSEKIEWGKDRSSESNSYNKTSRGASAKVNLSELEKRRKYFLTMIDAGSTYGQIKEKLIGETLHYQPDVSLICKKLISDFGMNRELSRELLENLKWFCSNMDSYMHHNLRTFQFYLSKISYLFSKLADISIEEKYIKAVHSFIIRDCFIWSVEFKMGERKKLHGWEQFTYETRTTSEAVKEYVEKGEYQRGMLRNDIQKFIEGNLRNRLMDEDPLNQLINNYYCNSQIWCEEKLQQISENLSENAYPIVFYHKIIIILERLMDIGFDQSYRNEFIKLMKKNIEHTSRVNLIDTDLFYLEDNKFRARVLQLICELNNTITEKDDSEKIRDLFAVLNSPVWVDELEKYVNEHNLKNYPEKMLFSKVTAEMWIDKLTKASAADIDRFRHILSSMYPIHGLRSITEYDDLKILQQIEKGIVPDNSNDLIVRAALNWLKKQIGTVLDLYYPDDNNG